MSDEENLNVNGGESEQATEIPETEETEEKEDSGEQSSVKEETTESSDNDDEVSKTYTQDQVEALMAKTKDMALRRAKRELEEKSLATNNDVSAGQNVASQFNEAAPSPDHQWDNVLGWIPNETSLQQYSKMVEKAINDSQQSQNVSSGQEQSQKASRPKVSDTFWDQLEKCCINHDDADVVLNSIPADLADYAARITKKDGLGIESIYRLQKENPQKMFEISRISDTAERQHAVTMLIHETAQRRKKKIKSNATPQPTPITGAGGAAGSKPYSDMSYEEKKAIRKKEDRF